MSILGEIVQHKQAEVATAKRVRPEQQLLDQLSSAPPVRDFFAALVEPSSIQLIAEVKRQSPSAGVIRRDFDPVAIAATYERHGAACLSVLTDQRYFGGSLASLAAIRAAVSLPVLRKEFVIDPYQVLEARCAGADAVLLIAECLDDCQLRSLHNRILELGMTPLVEFHDSQNCQRVVEAGAALIGINNRDLRTFQTNLSHTISLQSQIPTDCGLVSESGIRSHEDLQMLEAAGVDAVLVGEHLVRQPDIGSALARLLGR